VAPAECRGCQGVVGRCGRVSRTRRQVVEVGPAPPPLVTEYQLVSKLCPCCGARTTGEPGGDAAAETAAGPGGPVRVGPLALARCVLRTFAHLTLMPRRRPAQRPTSTPAGCCWRGSPECWSATATPATPTCPLSTPGAESTCCRAHLLRDLRSVAAADPDAQLWATGMAETLLGAHRAAAEARDRGADRLDKTVLSRLRSALPRRPCPRPDRQHRPPRRPSHHPDQQVRPP
jgi:hypothetical protein